ncbi:hypothetical protein [Paraliobacillus ryukyuensis]|uniref:hypothetical protein n=1 Tax=Paraliobacillus ryukyuensis TaxID=200904 RepID=UPI0009A81331|nr:hypothetical protein [Paraliobacillus ryukyuensis]
MNLQEELVNYLRSERAAAKQFLTNRERCKQKSHVVVFSKMENWEDYSGYAFIFDSEIDDTFGFLISKKADMITVRELGRTVYNYGC